MHSNKKSITERTACAQLPQEGVFLVFTHLLQGKPTGRKHAF